MGVLNSFKYADVVRLLKYWDCYFLREGSRKSHEIWFNPKTEKEITVVNHGSNECRMGTLLTSMKVGGITKEMIEEFHRNKGKK